MVNSKSSVYANNKLVWSEVEGAITPGGDAMYECPICKDRHIYGVEHTRNYTHTCKKCNTKGILYPFEVKN